MFVRAQAAERKLQFIPYASFSLRHRFCIRTSPATSPSPHSRGLFILSSLSYTMPLPRNFSRGLTDIPGLFQAFRTRCYSQQTVSVPSPATSNAPGAQLAQLSHPYVVPRNSRGSLPVYSDIRNGGTRYLVLVKNVHGNITVSKAPAPSLPLLRLQFRISDISLENHSH